MQALVSTPSLPHAPLDSSSLRSVGYLADAGALEITFRSGAVYRYSGVPPHIHQALLDAKSKGRYFNAAIRSNFPFERIQ